MGFKFPDGITEKHTFLKELNENGVNFKDGTSEEYDAIIKYTGMSNLLNENLTLVHDF